MDTHFNIVTYKDYNAYAEYCVKTIQWILWITILSEAINLSITIIPFSPVEFPIYLMYFEPTYSDNYFLDASVYNDNL